MAEVFVAVRAGVEGSECKLRVVHLVTEDAVDIDDNECRRFLQHFRSPENAEGLDCSLIVWKCASHQANLAVHVAVCGSMLARPVEQSDVCGTCVRLFKYVMPTYSEELGANLRRLVGGLRFARPADVDPSGAQRAQQLRLLYGDDVLPESLLLLLNSDLQSWTHVCFEGTNEQEIRSRVYSLMYSLTLVVQERPVITRFWHAPFPLMHLSIW